MAQEPYTLMPLTELASQRYALRSTLTQRMIKLETWQQSLTKVKLTYIKKLDDGGHLFHVTIESVSHRNPLLLFQLSDDLSRCMDKLLLETDSFGQIRQVLNASEVLNKWLQMRYGLADKYKQVPHIKELLSLFDASLKQDHQLLDAVRNKGVYSLLLGGYLGDYVPEQARANSKVLGNFFNQIALPLHVEYTLTHQRQEDMSDQWRLLGQGRLDEERFDRLSFIRQIRQAVNMYNLMVDFAVDFRESYEVDSRTRFMAYGQQSLRAEVEDIYVHESRHELIPLL